MTAWPLNMMACPSKSVGSCDELEARESNAEPQMSETTLAQSLAEVKAEIHALYPYRDLAEPAAELRALRVKRKQVEASLSYLGKIDNDRRTARREAS